MSMKYPTVEEIEKADRITIARWYRSLPSPGVNFIKSKDFVKHCNRESVLMDKINERFMEMGGMTPEISKIIGPLHHNY